MEISSDAILSNCTISDNIALGGNGGGIGVSESSPVFYNCLIKNNFSDQNGGAVSAGNNPGPTFINCTFVENRANSGASFYLNLTEMSFINSILWDQSSYEINFNGDYENTLTFANSIVKGGIEAIESLDNYEWNNVSWNGAGNMDSYPLFADTSNGDYALTNYSPAIGAGTVSVTIGGTAFTSPSTDIDGNLRPNPEGSNPDMGAYENALGSPATYDTQVIEIPGDYSTIQHGIDASSNGDTVLVYPGTYVENINYNGKNIVVGSLFLTYGDTSYISQTVIDGDQTGSVVTFESGEDSTTVLSGFVILNGNTNYGGGIRCDLNSNPVLSNIRISNNYSMMLSGIESADCSPVEKSIGGKFKLL